MFRFACSPLDANHHDEVHAGDKHDVVQEGGHRAERSPKHPLVEAHGHSHRCHAQKSH